MNTDALSTSSTSTRTTAPPSPPRALAGLKPLLVAACLAVIAFCVTPATASAAAGDVTCATGSSSSTYTPGLLLAPRPVSFSEVEIYTGCVSSTRPDIVSGVAPYGPVTLTASCLDPLLSGNVPDYVITWNTGETSTLNVNYTVTTAGGQIVSTARGTVTGGVFQGRSVLAVLTYLQLNLSQCLHPPGIQNAAGTATLSIS